MATTHATHLPREARLSGLRTWALVAAAVVAGALVGQVIGSRALPLKEPTTRPSIHNLIEGSGVEDAVVVPGVGAVPSEATLKVPPNLLESVEPSLLPSEAATGVSDYTVYKLEQVRGEATSPGNPVAPAADSPHVRNLLEGT